MKTYIKKLVHKYIGKMVYEVHILDIDGRRGYSRTFENNAQLDKFVCEINNNKYFIVVDIRKYITLNFTYKKEVISKPLWFSNQSSTEEICVDPESNINYSYFKNFKNMSNIKRI